MAKSHHIKHEDDVHNRRNVLLGMAAIPATLGAGHALASPGSTTAAAASRALTGVSGPITAADVRRLARDLQTALALWQAEDGDEWKIHVPARGDILLENLSQNRRLNAPLVSQKLADLIAAQKAAEAREDAACDRLTELEEAGEQRTKDADDEWHNAVNASDDALRRILHYRCRTDADRVRKAEFLMARIDDGWDIGALGRDEVFGLYALLRAMREEGRAAI